MFGRLYIGNVPSGSTAADLTTLIQKVCNVQDVYVPGGTITGFCYPPCISSLVASD